MPFGRPLVPPALALALALVLALPGSLAAAGSPGAATGGKPNGLAKLSAPQALAAADQALKAQPDIELAGSISEAGARVELHLRSADHGKRAAGTLESHSGKAGFAGTLRFVALSKTDYLNGGRAFWSSSLAGEKGLSEPRRARLASLLSGRWIKLTGKDAAAFRSGLSILTSPAALAGELTTPDGALHKGVARRVGKVLALPITSSKGGTLWLSVRGKPLPVELSAPPTSATSGRVSFRYPAKLVILAPARARSLAKLER